MGECLRLERAQVLNLERQAFFCFSNDLPAIRRDLHAKHGMRLIEFANRAFQADRIDVAAIEFHIKMS